MKLKDVKDRLNDAVETENPSGTSYYGAELDEEDVEAARERMEEGLRTHENAVDGDSEFHRPPVDRRQAP
jgi:hypothetical protein